MKKSSPPPALESEFGRCLRFLREERGWSQEEFADRCGIHRTYVSQLERGLKSPTLRLLWTICDSRSGKPGDFLRGLEAALLEKAA